MQDHSEKREAAQIAWQSVVQSRLGNLPHGAHSDRKDRAKLAEIEIEAMRDSLARALELRNTTASPACRLPPETLANVFLYLQAAWPMRLQRDEKVNPTDDPGADDLGEPFYHTKAWYNVAHVCRLWREAANTPLLWCTIACTDLPPEFLPLVLSRTRGLPLTLSARSLPLGVDASGMLEVLWREHFIKSTEAWLTAAVLKRVKRLAFEDGIRASDFAMCRTLLQRPMPILNSLDVIASASPHRVHHLRFGHPPFGTHEYPPLSLRRLTLSNCDVQEVPSRTLLTSSITHLTIENATGCDYTVYKLFSNIARMDRLEELVLANSFPKEDDYIGVSDPLRLPPSLRLLRVSASALKPDSGALSGCLGFTNRLIIPPATRAEIQLRGWDLDTIDESSEEDDDEDEDEWIDDASLDAGLTAFFLSGDYPDESPRELNISCDTFTMHTANTSPFIPPRSSSKACPGSRSFTLGCTCRHCLNTVLLQRLPALPLPALKSLSLQFSTWTQPPHGPNWWSNFLLATGIQRVSLEWSNWYCNDLWEAMTPSTDDSIVLFPALETIVIHDEDFPIRIQFESRLARATGTLIDMLHTRKDRQVPVGSILVDDRMKSWAIWSLVAEVTPVKFFVPS
ncbi:unnamed protein product [Peniophora sp. CBMAI 1063]|nr:unnamed protein product [Peniophora sp. CBMAI 1063]